MCPKGSNGGLVLMEYEYLRLFLGGSEDGLVWVGWWWEL